MADKAKRGSTNNGKRLATFLGRTGGDGKGRADWGTASPEWIQAVIIAISSVGGLASFGLSRDQGAHNLTILLDGERETLWFNQDADLDAELRKVYEAFNQQG